MLPTKIRARLAVALATVVALGAGALAVQQMTPASATPASSTPVFRAPSNVIQGVVVDQSGRAVDGITVEAVKADGSTDATELTYAGTWSGGPGHGYFGLDVTRGSYTLVLSAKGFKTVEYDAGLITKRRTTISMGEIEIQKISAPTTTSATLGKASVTTKENGTVTVTVADSTDKKAKVTGDVEVRAGGKVVGEATITKKADGTVTVTLDKLPRGAHKLTAYFLGTADHKPSSSKQLTLTVVKKKS